MLSILLANDTSFIDYASRGGVVGLLIVILYGGFKRDPWWVFGWVYRDLETRYFRRGEQLDKWWATAQKATATAEQLAQTKLPNDAPVGESEGGK